MNITPRTTILLAFAIAVNCSSGSMSLSDFLENYYTEYEFEHADFYKWNNTVNIYFEEDNINPPQEGGIVGIGSSSMVRWACDPSIQAEFEDGPQKRRLCWPGRIYDDLEDLTVIPRGFGGAHFTHVINYADLLIFPYKPRAVMVYAGDSDSQAGKSAERIRYDLASLVFYCRQNLPNLRFYIISIKPSKSREDVWPLASEANELMEAYCSETEGVTFIDVATGMFTSNGTLRSNIFIYDNLHLNETGYDIWSTAIAPVVFENEAKYEPGVSWNGYIIENGVVDTGDWIGQIYVENSPWVYSSALRGWLFEADSDSGTTSTTEGEWFYAPK